ncbi:MAG: hypothetical protein H6607_06505 [Flavobacteriales bacterium]|nr:hypothetical protein [Flavobacteriales bacterium]
MIFVSSCFTEEERIQPLPDSEQSLSLYRPFNGQIYYSLQHRKVVKQNPTLDWDLAFSCHPDKYTILLNYTKGMAAFNTQSSDFYKIYNEPEYPWVFEQFSTEEAQTSIGVWGDFSFENPQSFGQVYIINMGYGLNGEWLGMKKIKVKTFSEKGYTISFADMDNSNEKSIEVAKNDSFNFVYVSFFYPKTILHLEPSKDEWDLLFTTYCDSIKPQKTHPLYLQHLDKSFELAEGVLLNPHQRKIIQDSLITFNQIDFFKIEPLIFDYQPNYIGRTWYVWDSRTLKYRIDPNCFIIKDEEKNYYAVEFTNFGKTDFNRFSFNFRFKNL